MSSFPNSVGSPHSNRKAVNVKSVDNPADEPSRRCFVCGSRSHLKNECPEWSKSTLSRSNAKVNTCQIHTQHSIDVHTPVNYETAMQSDRVRDAEVQVCVESSVCDESLVDVHGVQSQIVDDNTVLDEYQSACEGYDKLQYIDVKVTDCVNSDVKVVSALSDSGAQISVIRSDVLGKLDVPYIGKVKLRGIVGSPVTADLIKINVALSNDDLDDNEYVTVLCAVCAEANDDLVLASSVVDSLYNRQLQLINNACHG